MSSANVKYLHEYTSEKPGTAEYGDEFDIPKGTYSACIVDVSTKLFFFRRSPKVVLTFRILDTGLCFGKLVRAFYAVKSLNGKPRPNGRFSVGPRSRLLRDMAKVITSRPPTDHVPVSLVESAILEISVRIVDWAGGEDLPESMQYAVVDRILRKMEG